MAPGARGAAARGSARGRGRRGRDRGRGRPQASVPPDAPADDAPADADICFICAEPVRMYSVPPCNHRVCHICSMRLRALWKKRECTFCKAEATRVIFTRHPTKGFGEFTADELPCSDEKLAIYFETEQDYHDTISLLRFHCPQPQCETLCSGWADLKAHAKREHTRLLCDLCVQHKKIFAHEHTLFTASSLQAHLSAEHKYCEYCRQHYYSDDELWVHMRDRHEQCHICKNRSEDERWRYYKDYRMLEQHFHEAHYLCPAKECLERKFVVFENQMEFQVHQLEEHGRALSARERKEALRVDPRFMYEGESSGRARGKKPARDTDTAGHARRAQFGRTLTSAADDEWDAVAALLHSPIKLTACQAALQAYRSGETTVDDLLRTVHTLTGESGQASGGPTHRVVQHLGDMLGAGEKADALQRAWAATQAQASFPSLAASTAPRTSARQAPARNAAHFPSLAAANSRAPASAPRAQGSSSASHSVAAARGAGSSRAGLHASQFPSLPTNQGHAERQAQKRELLGTRARTNPLVPAPPPPRWGAPRAPAWDDDAFPSLSEVSGALPPEPEPEPVPTGGSGKQRRRKAVLLSSVGSMHQL
ncbi:RING-type E3 ubiquitin transferase [Malassezia caprae]|uniref:RING-type E3 ubiquitin transferase n=1 Tax=Malassezia caprae TaxID=1381934 RepID=A0AAF0E485_9BASI|nr:RING-type E3 ubiquitin transferase [Malassezia caprae]